MTDSNPYARQLADAQQKVKQSQGERRDHAERLSWFRAFNAQTAHTHLSQFNRQSDELLRETAALKSDIESGKAAVRELESAASLGFDPRHWFSTERTAAKEKFVATKAAVSLLLSRQAALRSETATLKSKMAMLQANLNRHRAFDSLQSEAAIRSIDHNLDLGKSEIDVLTRLKRNLDDQLKAPLANLQVEQREEARLISKIDRAEVLGRRLSNAANGKERASIHQQCGDEFQDRSPGKVVNSLCSKLESVRRRIEKQKASVDLVLARATRIVRSVVIDGNNVIVRRRPSLPDGQAAGSI